MITTKIHSLTAKDDTYELKNKRRKLKMFVQNTENMRRVQNVAATMAIEDMPLDENFIKKLIKVSNGEKTMEELLQEINQKYARQ